MAFTALNTSLFWTATLLAIFFSSLSGSIPTVGTQPVQLIDNHNHIRTFNFNFNFTFPVDMDFPNPTDSDSADDTRHLPQKRWGAVQFCSVSTFITQISDASPLIADCIKLMDKFLTKSPREDYAVKCRQRTITDYGTCKLGISTVKSCDEGGRGVILAFGAGDAAYVINESIRLLGDTRIGKVGTTGNLRCWRETDTGWQWEPEEPVEANWGLY